MRSILLSVLFAGLGCSAGTQTREFQQQTLPSSGITRSYSPPRPARLPAGRALVPLYIPPSGIISAFEVRGAVLGLDVQPAYTSDDMLLMQSGKVRKGLDEAAAYLAFGRPAIHFATGRQQSVCRVLLYSTSNPGKIDQAVHVCSGEIVDTPKLDPALPAWRLKEVSSRVLPEIGYFEHRPIITQYEILFGHVARGQYESDVFMALGKPYRSGTETNQDGEVISSHVFLDTTGEFYGLTIQVTGRQVASWRFPARRILTPEAQEARLRASEARIAAARKAQVDANRAEYERKVQAKEDDSGGFLSSIGSVVRVIAPIVGSALEDELREPPPRTKNRTRTRTETRTRSRERNVPDKRRCTLPERSSGKICITNEDCHNGTACFGDDPPETIQRGDTTIAVGRCRGKEVIKMKCD